MGIRSSIAAASIVVTLTLLINGCATFSPLQPAGSTDSVSPAATPQPQALIVSNTGLSVVDDAGTTVESADFADPTAMVAFLTTWVGPAPGPEVDEHFGTSTYAWTGITLLVRNAHDGGSVVHVTAAQVGGLDASAESIQVGSPLADVVADADFDSDYDQDGDGDTDLFGLDAQPFPDAESLFHPGEAGTTYIGVYLTADTVSSIVAPDDDFHDV
jgi:hypothetical protein